LLLIAINPKSCWLKLRNHLPATRSWLSDVTLQRYEVAWLGMWLAERWQSVGKTLRHCWHSEDYQYMRCRSEFDFMAHCN
jgi:hypothetical protein